MSWSVIVARAYTTPKAHFPAGTVLMWDASRQECETYIEHAAFLCGPYGAAYELQESPLSVDGSWIEYEEGWFYEDLEKGELVGPCVRA